MSAIDPQITNLSKQSRSETRILFAFLYFFLQPNWETSGECSVFSSSFRYDTILVVQVFHKLLKKWIDGAESLLTPYQPPASSPTSGDVSQLGNFGLCGEIEFLQKYAGARAHTHTEDVERENITGHNGNHMVYEHTRVCVCVSGAGGGKRERKEMKV